MYIVMQCFPKESQGHIFSIMYDKKYESVLCIQCVMGIEFYNC
jgi:hypothetical protein